MNERMIELAQQATIIGQSETTLAPTSEQFAELIVRECITACGSWSGIEQIKQHFGVEP